LPSIDGLYREFRTRGLSVLLVNMGEDPDLVRRTVTARGYAAPVLLDTDRSVVRAYGVSATPTVYLLDRRHGIVARAIGRREWAGEEGRRLLDALLAP
jgi:cytochrome c biogenesis protein CcmG, thiol:disulfide interchange protein DsbE